MKRNNIVLNARDVRAGRRLLRCAAGRFPLTIQARALLARGAAFAAKFAQSARMAAPDGAVTQSDVGLLVLAAYDGRQEAIRIASELTEAAFSRQTFDDEAEACLRLADAIRFIGSR